MDRIEFDAWTRRRFAAAAGGLSATLLGIAGGDAKKKRKPKKKKVNRCRPDGGRCGKESKQCQAKFCLRTRFTIEATWNSGFPHDAYLIVPEENASTGPGPYFNFTCNEANSQCESKYPFACITESNSAPGEGITTIYTLLPGTYEYWIQLHDQTDAMELKIVLRNKNGDVVREWRNQENQNVDRGWHVFNIDGKTGSITSIDELADQTLPKAAVDPFTFVCTF
jgi:hypothetical protein